MIKYLIARGANVNDVDYFRLSCLTRAAEVGWTAIVEVLIDNGADVEFAGLGSRTAIVWAAEKGHLEIVKLLLMKGKACKHRHNSALVAAEQKSHTHVVKYLTDHDRGHGSLLMVSHRETCFVHQNC